MYDNQYFNHLLDETLYLIENQEKTPDNIENQEEIEANILTLKFMITFVTEEELKNKLIDKLKGVFKNMSFDFKVKAEEKENSTLMYALEDELKMYSSALKNRAKTFKEKVEEDKSVVETTNNIIEKQVIKTDENISNMKKIEGVSLYTVFVFSFLLFFVFYFIINYL
ncbi:hypothetical protein H311_02019 [Anncaliia algerae PRA109]|nr:hypothetical protein H311_03444 [Anncaliia algerae PRA109]KCZ76979.1 hypothetical protein H311_02019 [Anncaliia algerae PRA109]